MRIDKFIFIVICNLISLYSQCQVLKGGDISIKNISSNTYSVLTRIAIDWPVSISKPYVKINWGDGNSIDSLIYVGSDCTLYGATTLYYHGNHTFSPNNTYTISILDSFFVSGIVNIPNSSSVKMYLRSELNTNSIYQPNTSVNTQIVCLTDSVGCCNMGVHNPGAHDIDGDSLSYALVIPPYANYVQPPATINPITGTLTFTSNPYGQISVSIRIDEWRNIGNVYNKIASTYQELFFKIYNSVGLKDYSKENLELYIFPNPTTSIINIVDENNQLQNATIQIQNYLGQLVFTSSFTSQINLSSFSAGIYFLTIENKANKKTLKIIKQ